jgi:hypothetical protein
VAPEVNQEIAGLEVKSLERSSFDRVANDKTASKGTKRVRTFQSCLRLQQLKRILL